MRFRPEMVRPTSVSILSAMLSKPVQNSLSNFQFDPLKCWFTKASSEAWVRSPLLIVIHLPIFHDYIKIIIDPGREHIIELGRKVLGSGIHMPPPPGDDSLAHLYISNPLLRRDWCIRKRRDMAYGTNLKPTRVF